MKRILYHPSHLWFDLQTRRMGLTRHFFIYHNITTLRALMLDENGYVHDHSYISFMKDDGTSSYIKSPVLGIVTNKSFTRVSELDCEKVSIAAFDRVDEYSGDFDDYLTYMSGVFARNA